MPLDPALQTGTDEAINAQKEGLELPSEAQPCLFPLEFLQK